MCCLRAEVKSASGIAFPKDRNIFSSFILPHGRSQLDMGNDDDIEEARVTFTKSKVTTTWRAKDKLSILQLAEREGLKPDFGCRR